MGLLSNIFSTTGLEAAGEDRGTIYADVLGENGVVDSLIEGNVAASVEALAGDGGVIDEATSGDGLGLTHLLAPDTLVGDLVG